MSAVLPSRTQLTDQLVRMVDVRLLDPFEILLDGDPVVVGLRTMLRTRADRWAARILGDDDRAAVATVMRTMAALYPSDVPFDPPVPWWGTPMGRALAWRVGHPTAASVSYPVAGAMLGITRQGVHDLVTRGRLTRHPDGGVVPSSIRDRLRSL